jgi:hypothetical protein
MTGVLPTNLFAMQGKAFNRIAQSSERYADDDHAIAIYVQGTLFDWSISQRHETESVAERSKLAAAKPECVLLFPDEFRELRLRAAYHGAGLATEAGESIPRDVHCRLSDNLENYRPEIDYEQLHMPWMYSFRPEALRKVLKHDFGIAASDDADGDLNRLCLETGEDED